MTDILNQKQILKARFNMIRTNFLSNFVFIFTITIFLFSCGNQPKWYKGNLHTHSFWSDGDDYPEMVMSWYKEHDYDFIALSDHNILTEGEKWIDVTKSKGGTKAYEKYKEKFGSEWIETKTEDGNLKARLKTLEEYRTLFEEKGKFLIIQAEEISDSYDGKPIHLNAINNQELIPPQKGNSIQEVIQNNLDAVLEQRKVTGVPIIPHLNHPNFGWALKVEDMIDLTGEKFFEVYNGHPSVRNEGDSLHISTERIWDIVLSFRLTKGLPVMYGIAVDDAHSYHNFTPKHANPGRGWLMVHANDLSPESLIEAMEAGNFYGSTGVTLENIQYGKDQIAIKIKSETGVDYKTQFIGTFKDFDSSTKKIKMTDSNNPIRNKYSNEIGEILEEIEGSSPAYKLKGNELYIRAKVISTKIKENSYREGKVEVAWTQPYVLK